MDFIDNEVKEHFQVFEEALNLYMNRSEPYGEVWKNYGALANLLNAARKIDRLMNAWWHEGAAEMPLIHKDALDDAFDALNYLAFFIRCAREGNFTGFQQSRP